MSNVEFNEYGPSVNVPRYNTFIPNISSKGLQGFLINHNIAKNQAQANLQLITIIIGCLILTGFFSIRTYKNSHPHVLIYKEDISSADKTKYSQTFLNGLPSKKDEK